ncbi:ABC transporter substrate-binding protein [Nocardia terpenica]|uniref:LacI family transcriptional regulator n=1 Tax=Nocardia terpenica TaxID=455432 RepID=A0A164NHM1_9NOCA|nr:ABC transporter substrate-binding protein [Nocardia terpenica]KZM74374.1 LacI family transcriptional regulator [Nocardia terpenica]NQE93031.1 ABC transporter substrate-binding protein [Nocardia terpenica]
MSVHKTAAGVAMAAALAAAVSGCSKSESGSTAASGTGPAASAAAVQPGGQQTCTIEQTGYPRIDPKTAKIGFSQSEKEANPFRITETDSIRDQAAKLGIPAGNLLITNAQSDLDKQVGDIKSMLDQGVQALIVAPLNSDGLQPALDAARAKKVPVITIDRQVTSRPCTDYVTFIGSDFVHQGERAADQMVRVTGGRGKIAILLGSSGNNVTTDRTKGFKDKLTATPGLAVVAEQTGDFDRSKGQSVMEQLLQSHPDITAVYAENDEMGIGAVNAIRGAGKQPGKDIKIVSVDGTRNAVQLIVSGDYNADIESNPRFGPLAFQTLQQFEDGRPVPATVIISDNEYDETTAAAKIGDAY